MVGKSDIQVTVDLVIFALRDWELQGEQSERIVIDIPPST